VPTAFSFVRFSSRREGPVVIGYTLARFSPATYALEGMRAALLDGAGTGVLLGYLGRLLLIGVVAIPVGLAIFRQAEKYAKRTGRLKRSG
jgi:ABC-2 type transport system permease protein